MARIAPIEPAAWPETLADIRRQMGTPLNVHRALASYPAWLRAWFPFRNHVVHGTSLSSRQYELVVLRVATLTDAAYEWEHHVVTAKEAGLDDEEIGRVRAGGDAPGWSRDESALSACGRRVHRGSVHPYLDTRFAQRELLAGAGPRYRRDGHDVSRDGDRHADVRDSDRRGEAELLDRER